MFCVNWHRKPTEIRNHIVVKVLNTLLNSHIYIYRYGIEPAPPFWYCVAMEWTCWALVYLELYTQGWLTSLYTLIATNSREYANFWMLIKPSWLYNLFSTLPAHKKGTLKIYDVENLKYFNFFFHFTFTFKIS